MKIHNVKQPFMCKIGQFVEGKQTLCIGIEKNALQKAQEFRVHLGKNNTTHYDISYDKAMEVVAEHGNNAQWKSKNGKLVFILPIDAFTISKDEVIKKEEVKIELQPSLL